MKSWLALIVFVPVSLQGMMADYHFSNSDDDDEVPIEWCVKNSDQGEEENSSLAIEVDCYFSDSEWNSDEEEEGNEEGPLDKTIQQNIAEAIGVELRNVIPSSAQQKK